MEIKVKESLEEEERNLGLDLLTAKVYQPELILLEDCAKADALLKEIGTNMIQEYEYEQGTRNIV